MPDANPFQPMEGDQAYSTGGHPHDRGESTVDSGDLARAAAAAAVRGEQESNTASPGTQFSEGLPHERDQQAQQPPQQQQTEPQQRRQESDSDSYTQFEPMDEPGDQQQQSQQQQQQEPQQQTQTQDEGWQVPEYDELQEMGVDVPVSPDEVPEDFRDSYSQLTQSLLDAEHSVRDRLKRAEQEIAQVENFKQTLQTEEGQKRLLLGLALRDQEVFNDTVQMVQRMADDPEYAQSVQREIEADLKLQAAEQRAAALNRAERATKGRQVENRTVRLANRLGVNEDLAKKMVVAKIRENHAQTGELDISLQEVDDVVKGLADEYGARQRAKSPETQQKQQQANTQRATGTGQEPNQQQQTQAQQQTTQRGGQPSDQGGSANAMDRLRGAVRTAAQNVRSKGL